MNAKDLKKDALYYYTTKGEEDYEFSVCTGYAIFVKKIGESYCFKWYETTNIFEPFKVDEAVKKEFQNGVVNVCCELFLKYMKPAKTKKQQQEFVEMQI